MVAQRTWQQMAEDRVLALGNYGWGNMWSVSRTPSKRGKAVERACRRLPDDLYQRFKDRMQSRVWFIPSLGLAGCAKALPQSAFIYLSPIWEAADDELVEYVALHEMLHVILDHNTELNGVNEDERQLNELQEQQVASCIQQLGIKDRHEECLAFVAQAKVALGIKE